MDVPQSLSRDKKVFRIEGHAPSPINLTIPTGRLPSYAVNVSKEWFRAVLTCSIQGGSQPTEVYIFRNSSGVNAFCITFIIVLVRYRHVVLIQSSRNCICSSVWNQCSPFSITVSTASCCFAKERTVSNLVKLSLFP